VGAGFTAWALVGSALAFSVVAGAEVELKTFLGWVIGVALGLLGLVFLNWTYSVLSLAYILDDQALTIRWGFRRVIVPIETIQRMVPGRTLDEPHISGLNWWGCHVGSADVKRLGFTIFYSTHSAPDELLYIVTTDESYGLTVPNQAAFAEIQGARSSAPRWERCRSGQRRRGSRRCPSGGTGSPSWRWRSPPPRPW
jgi:hypothetical protein